MHDAALNAGAKAAYLIEEPIAAALGARLMINEPTANMIVDIGGGTTEIAVMSMGGIVTAKSLKLAGDKFNEDIMKFIRDEFKLVIGEPTAEELKIEIGSAIPIEEKLELVVRGRDMSTGLPREISVRGSQVRMALSRSLRSVIEAIKEIIEITPPELVGDILKEGIYLCGGGSLLKGFDQLIEKEISVKATVIDDPLTCVARGTGIASENIKSYSQIFATALKPMEIKI